MELRTSSYNQLNSQDVHFLLCSFPLIQLPEANYEPKLFSLQDILRQIQTTFTYVP